MSLLSPALHANAWLCSLEELVRQASGSLASSSKSPCVSILRQVTQMCAALGQLQRLLRADPERHTGHLMASHLLCLPVPNLRANTSQTQETPG